MLDRVLPWDGDEWNLKVIDPACGSGIFLVKAFQRLVHRWKRSNPGESIRTETLRNLLERNIFGVDKDYNAVEATKFGLLLKLLEGEDVNSTNATKPVLPDLSQNIFFGNSLLNPKQVNNKKDQVIINPFDFSKLCFDVIVGNPPYMKSEDMKNITLSIDDDLLNAGREYARKHNVSLNALVRRLLEHTVARKDNGVFDEMFEIMDKLQVSSDGKRWSREELYRV